jgi:hypothetical protein
MIQTVQLSISDGRFQGTVRDALIRNCAWHVECVELPDPSQPCVLVLDEAAFARLPLPLSNPERVVLVTRKGPQLLSEAWDAGIVSVVSAEDPPSTVLLAIMAAALRVAKSSGISPNVGTGPAPLPPESHSFKPKRLKIQ